MRKSKTPLVPPCPTQQDTSAIGFSGAARTDSAPPESTIGFAPIQSVSAASLWRDNQGHH